MHIENDIWILYEFFVKDEHNVILECSYVSWCQVLHCENYFRNELSYLIFVSCSYSFELVQQFEKYYLDTYNEHSISPVTVMLYSTFSTIVIYIYIYIF